MKFQPRHHGCRVSELTWNQHTLVVLENSLLRVTVLATRGAEITEFRFKPMDLDVLWHADHPTPPATTHVPATATGVDVFFDSYAGCWQESFPAGNTPGVYRGATFGTHGEVSGLPWNFAVTRDRPGEIEVEFSVACLRTPFRLKRRMSLKEGSTRLRLDEEITNAGGVTLEFAWGQHPAFGPPFLTPSCVLDLPVGIYRTRPDGLTKPRLAPGQKSSRPQVRGVDGRMVDLRRVAPERGGTMDNFEVELRGPGRVALRNPQRDLGVGMRWDRRAFPYMWEWESSHGHAEYPFWCGSHHVALEPFNCPIGGLVDFAGKNMLPKIRPGARHTGWLEAGFCRGRSPFRDRFL